MKSSTKTLTEIITEQQQATPVYFDDPMTDRLLTEVLRLAEEVCVLRDRLDTSERLAAAGTLATRDAVDEFAPDADIIESRLAAHRTFFAQTFAELQRRT